MTRTEIPRLPVLERVADRLAHQRAYHRLYYGIRRLPAPDSARAHDALDLATEGLEGVADGHDLDAQLDAARVARWAVTHLDARSLRVLVRRLQGWTLAEVAHDEGLCREYTRQIERGAVERVREWAGGDR